MKGTQISRAQLWEALQKGDQAEIEKIAQALGLHYHQTALQDWSDLGAVTLEDQGATLNASLETKALNKSPTAQLSYQFWQLLKQENKDDKHKKETDDNSQQKVSWRKRPKPAKYHELITLKDFRSRILPALNKQEKGRKKLDIAKLIDKISRAELVAKIPKTKQKQSLQALQIIDDRQRHLIPYYIDHGLLSLKLYDELAHYQISRAVIEQGEKQARSIIEKVETHEIISLQTYQLPPAETTVLLLSDLGRLTPAAKTPVQKFNQRQKIYWSLIQSLIKNDNSIIVISPCQLRDYPTEITQIKQLQLLSWEPQTAEQQQEMKAPISLTNKNTIKNSPLENWRDFLLVLASPFSRLEPELLRSLRLGLAQFDFNIPLAVESLLWQHPNFSSIHSVAATIEEKERKKYRELFLGLDTSLQRFAIKTLRHWRATLSKEIWFIELLDIEASLAKTTLNNATFKKYIDSDIEDANNFIKQVNQQKMLANNLNQGDFQAWCANVDHFISADTLKKGIASKALWQMFAKMNPDSIKTPAGHIIPPDLIKPTLEKVQKLWLCQQGSLLVVSPLYDESRIPKQGTSLIAPIGHSNRRLNIALENERDRSIELPEIKTSQMITDNILLLSNTRNIPNQGELTINTDQTELTLKAIEKPTWASAMGRDAYGLYADVVLNKKYQNQQQQKQVTLRFRWIPAGNFMMGSPSTEVDRDDDEDYHRVTLSQGYWLADTTVTQALWQSTMDENPAHFKGEDKPVEEVSWDDTQRFIKRINQQVLTNREGLMFRLPTEAEWEYACRAGTTGPFSFGTNISPEVVNYNGNHPYHDAPKGKYRGGTVAVKSLPANPWGLYEMHGNVWEWCADAWQEQLGELAVQDPYNDGDSDTVIRVLRGGSWNDLGRGVRSAIRDRYSPDFRSDSLGLRLSLGPELQLRSKKKT